MRIASPCPTSRTVTRATVEGRLAATAPVTPIDATRAYVARRMSRAWRVGARPIAGFAVCCSRSPAPARPPRVPAGRDRRRQAIATPAPIADASPRATPTGGSSTTLAKGSIAAASTMPIMSRSATQPGAARIAPTTPGAPIPTSAPPMRATSPAAMAGATSGTITRLTAGAMSGEPSERREDDRQRRRLRSERDAEALDEPAGQSVAGRAIEGRRPWRGPRDEAGRCEARQLEAGIGDEPGIGEEKQRDGPAERRRGAAAAAGLAGKEDDARHRARRAGPTGTLRQPRCTPRSRAP